MPRALLKPPLRRLHRALALGVAVALACAMPEAAAATVRIAVEVPEGKTKTVRLRNLPRGAIAAVKISTDGKLLVAFVSAVQLKSSRPEALFRGVVDRDMAFQLVIPESSDYYLMLDNRRGTEPVKTRATIQAERDPSRPPKPPPAKGDGKFKETRAAPPLDA
jgi:hypothetical protein